MHSYRDTTDKTRGIETTSPPKKKLIFRERIEWMSSSWIEVRGKKKERMRERARDIEKIVVGDINEMGVIQLAARYCCCSCCCCCCCRVGLFFCCHTFLKPHSRYISKGKTEIFFHITNFLFPIRYYT